jgi:L-threonylcarbamoyladenylate synthase
MDFQIQSCVETLAVGGVILYPTDTVWGIGCDATNPDAVEKIFRIKRRDESKSLIILLADPEQLQEYVHTIPSVAYDLLSHVDSPLTIIYPDSKNLAQNVIASDGSIAIRIIHHEFCKRLIRTFGKPIVSTSANISGDPPPMTFRNIASGILTEVDFAVDESMGSIWAVKPSRIIRLNANGEFQIIRN